jgi:hypothetical protein
MAQDLTVTNPHDIDWNALAAEVTAHFNQTGQWGLIDSWLEFGTPFPSSPREIDWNALAAEVTAHFDQTGQWGLIDSWLEFGTPFPPTQHSTDLI